VEAGLASATRGAELEPRATSAHSIASGLYRLRATWLSAHGEDARPALLGAVTEARRAIQLQPGLAAPYNNLGTALYFLALEVSEPVESRQHLDAAIRAFERCTELAPRLAACHVNLGNSWKELAEREIVAGGDAALLLHKSILAFEVALPLNPTSAPLQNNLGNVHLTLAQQQMKRGDDPTAALDRAVGHYRKALDLRERYALAALNVGIAERMRAEAQLSARKPVEGAIDAARRALELAEQWNAEDADAPLERTRVELIALKGKIGNGAETRRQAESALARAERIQPNAPALAELRRELQR
jgi:hypothetical protein